MEASSIAVQASETVLILPASLKDLFALYRLEKRCFPLDSWPFIDILAALLIPSMVRLKAVDGGQLIGFVLGDREGRVGWIATIGVDPDYQRKGIGSAMLRAAERAMKAPVIKLCVRASNEAALSLYTGFGYRVVETWQRYYRGGEDALVMEKIARSEWESAPGAQDSI